MKRIVIAIVSILAVTALLGGASVAMAAKPQKSGSGKDVIYMSNGFPSGAHETLNIHGKPLDYVCHECEPCSGPDCIEPVQCNVIDIPEIGIATIKYVSGRKVKIDELTVFDSCAGWSEGDIAEVWLPYEEEGYFVFARALGKPAKGYGNVGYEPRNIIIENTDLEAYTPIIGDITGPGDIPVELPLGLITNGTYKAVSTDDTGVKLIRFDSEPEGKGRGKTLGKDITDMLLWSGYVFQPILDTNGDGLVDEGDVPLDYDLDDPADGIQYDEFLNWLNDHMYGYVFPLTIGEVRLDTNYDGLVNEEDVPLDYDLDDPADGIQYDEFLTWVEDVVPEGTELSDYWIDLWQYYPDEDPIWIFTIADLVYQYQVVTNEGIKNLQIRFYPVATTDFLQKNRIVVDKETTPDGSTQSFDFTLVGDGVNVEFSLTDGANPYTSTYLPPGTYYVTEVIETMPAGWYLDSIVPAGDSTVDAVNISTAKATIELEANERVTVIFNNIEGP